MDDTIIIALIKSIEDLDGEEWRPIRGSLVYFVSNRGRVKSRNKHQMKILTQRKNNKGYWRVRLSLQLNQPKEFLVSRLVAEAFTPDGNAEIKQVHHKNGKDNNSVECLSWLTKEEHDKEHTRIRASKRKKADGKK